MDWIGGILASDAFRGGALLTTALSGLTAIVLLIIKNRPLMVKQAGDERIALDASIQVEFKRLAERIDLTEARADRADARAEQCEKREQVSRERIRNLEDEVAGLRKQLIQFQESSIRILADVGTIPADMKSSITALS